MLSTIVLAAVRRICYGTEKRQWNRHYLSKSKQDLGRKIYLGLDETGKEKFKYFSGKTETEVKKKIREYNQSGTRIETKKISLQEYLNNWLKTYKRGTIKDSSYDAIEKTAKNQIIPYIGMIQLQEITATDIQALLVELKEKGYSYSTVKKAHDCLNAMFEHATISDDVAKNPHAFG